MYQKITIGLLVSLLLVSCGGKKSTQSQQTNKATTNQKVVSQKSKKQTISTYHIQNNIPYAEYAEIAENVKTECTDLGLQLSNSMVKYAPSNKIKVIQTTDGLPKENKSVEVTIHSVYSGGNAFLGHRKSVTVKAKLLVDGVEVDSTTKTRDSSGGFFGGFKSSCSVLERTVNTLGNDLGKWLNKIEV